MNNNAIVSFRIFPQRWINDDRFAELMELFAAHPGVADELTFFSQDTHSPLPLDVIENHAYILAKRMHAARENGYKAGINHLATIGHLNENLSYTLSDEYGRIVGIDGTVAQGSLCPNDEKVRKYIAQAYHILASANPDYIWMDDDLRLANHYPVMVGCFCDNCLSEFEKECGVKYTRESLHYAMNNGPVDKKLACRKAWVEHHKATMANLFKLIEKSIHETNPNIAIGIMPTELLFDGYNYAQSNEILSGANKTDVMWRPGEAFYFDDYPTGLLVKSHSIGRQVSKIPNDVTSIQAEIEDFPYQPLKKSKHTNALEGAAYIAAGCTGAAFNVLPLCDEKLSEYSPLISKLAETRPFYDLMMQNMGRSKTSGLYTGWCSDSIVVGNLLEGDWLENNVRNNIFNHADEILSLGMPVAYSLDDAQVTLLSGNSVVALKESEIYKMLSSGVYMDAQALSHLNEMGYGELTGFNVGDKIEKEGIEKYTNHPINAGFEGSRRDARQAFVWWAAPVMTLIPTSNKSQTLAQIVNYADTVVSPCCMGMFENNLGGRICVGGYYPWTFLQSFAKSTQIKSIMCWLSKNELQAYVDSFHKVAIWSRETKSGECAVALINTSLDSADNLSLMLKTKSSEIRVFDMCCKETKVVSTESSGLYKKFLLPAVNPWDMRLVLVRENI